MVTAEQVQEAVAKAGLTRIELRDCSICRTSIGYSVSNGDLYFHSACGCSWSPPEARKWQDAADHINRQTRTGRWGDVAAREAEKFGLTLEPIGVD
jgi:hypothetical protein